MGLWGGAQKAQVRSKFVSVLKEKFADLKLTSSIGGQISFDVSTPEAQASRSTHPPPFVFVSACFVWSVKPLPYQRARL